MGTCKSYSAIQKANHDKASTFSTFSHDRKPSKTTPSDQGSKPQPTNQSNFLSHMGKSLAKTTHNLAYKALSQTVNAAKDEILLTAIGIGPMVDDVPKITLEPVPVQRTKLDSKGLVGEGEGGHVVVFRSTVCVPTGRGSVSLSLRLASGAAKSGGALGSAIAGSDFPLGGCVVPVSGVGRVEPIALTGEGSKNWESDGAMVHASVVGPRLVAGFRQPGWAVTDPRVRPGSSNRLCSVFTFPTLPNPTTPCHVPLTLGQSISSSFLVCAERTVESSTVLPLSAALTRLLASGAATSSAHAWSIAQKVKRRAGAFLDAQDAMTSGHACCAVKVHSFTRSWAVAAVGVKNPDAREAVVRASMQPLGCVFARELLR